MMNPVSNVDRLVMILRQRIVERSRAGKAAGRPRTGQDKAAPVDSLMALAAAESVDDHQLRRALVQNILIEQFGDAMANEPRFQQIIDRVTEALEGDEAGASLIDRFVQELRGGVR